MNCRIVLAETLGIMALTNTLKLVTAYKYIRSGASRVPEHCTTHLVSIQSHGENTLCLPGVSNVLDIIQPKITFLLKEDFTWIFKIKIPDFKDIPCFLADCFWLNCSLMVSLLLSSAIRGSCEENFEQHTCILKPITWASQSLSICQYIFSLWTSWQLNFLFS